MDEGYIKFNIDWLNEPIASDFFSVDSFLQINNWRNKLHELGLIGAYPNGVGFGNISIRIGDRKFIITGSKTGHIPKLSREHYTEVVEFDFQKNWLKCIGPVKASSESLTHAAVYESDPKIQAVIHIHSLALWNYLRRKVPETSDQAAYGTPEMAEEVLRLFGNPKNLKDPENSVISKKIFVMLGHKEGVVSFGRDLDEAGNILLDWNSKALNKS